MASMDIIAGVPIYEQFNDAEYYRSFIKNSIRPDGRKFSEHRRLAVKSGIITAPNVYGSAQVQIEKTIVLCGINIMVGSPSMADPEKGDLDCEVNLSPLCDVKYDQRNKHADATSIESAVLDAIVLGNLLQLDQLCIVQGKYCYRLCINITCLSNGGNLMDASILAAIFALKDVKLPEPIVLKESVEVNPAKFTRLNVSSTCVPVTLGLLDGLTYLVDLNQEEERLVQGRVTCVIDTVDGSLRYLKQSDGMGWTVNQIKDAIALSTRVAVENIAALRS